MRVIGRSISFDRLNMPQATIHGIMDMTMTMTMTMTTTATMIMAKVTRSTMIGTAIATTTTEVMLRGATL